MRQTSQPTATPKTRSIYGIGKISDGTIDEMSVPKYIRDRLAVFAKKAGKSYERRGVPIPDVVQGKIDALTKMATWKPPEGTEFSEGLYGQKELETITQAYRKAALNATLVKNANARNSLIARIWARDASIPDDMERVRAVFNEIETAKLTVFWNNRVDEATTKGKNPPKKIDEDELTRKVRTEIAKWEREKANLSNGIRLLKSLEPGQFQSAEAFARTLEATFWNDQLQLVDWRDRPFIVQFAVGNNEKIGNPYYRAGSPHQEYCDWEWGMQTGSGDLKKWIRSLTDILVSLSKNPPRFHTLENAFGAIRKHSENITLLESLPLDHSLDCDDDRRERLHEISSHFIATDNRETFWRYANGAGNEERGNQIKADIIVKIRAEIGYEQERIDREIHA